MEICFLLCTAAVTAAVTAAGAAAGAAAVAATTVVNLVDIYKYSRYVRLSVTYPEPILHRNRCMHSRDD